jgi:hypothetical protein
MRVQADGFHFLGETLGMGAYCPICARPSRALVATVLVRPGPFRTPFGRGQFGRGHEMERGFTSPLETS